MANNTFEIDSKLDKMKAARIADQNAQVIDENFAIYHGNKFSPMKANGKGGWSDIVVTEEKYYAHVNNGAGGFLTCSRYLAFETFEEALEYIQGINALAQWVQDLATIEPKQEEKQEVIVVDVTELIDSLKVVQEGRVKNYVALKTIQKDMDELVCLREFYRKWSIADLQREAEKINADIKRYRISTNSIDPKLKKKPLLDSLMDANRALLEKRCEDIKDAIDTNTRTIDWTKRQIALAIA